MNALETFGHDDLNTREPHTLRGPVARRALSVIRTGHDDQRLLALHVGFNRLPHARDLAFGLDPGERTRAHGAVRVANHFIFERRVGEGRAQRGQVISAMRCIRVEVLFR